MVPGRSTMVPGRSTMVPGRTTIVPVRSTMASGRSTLYCPLSAVYRLPSNVCCLLSTVYCLLSTVYCLSSVFLFQSSLSVTSCLKSVDESVSKRVLHQKRVLSHLKIQGGARPFELFPKRRRFSYVMASLCQSVKFALLESAVASKNLWGLGLIQTRRAQCKEPPCSLSRVQSKIRAVSIPKFALQ